MLKTKQSSVAQWSPLRPVGTLVSWEVTAVQGWVGLKACLANKLLFFWENLSCCCNEPSYLELVRVFQCRRSCEARLCRSGSLCGVCWDEGKESNYPARVLPLAHIPAVFTSSLVVVLYGSGWESQLLLCKVSFWRQLPLLRQSRCITDLQWVAEKEGLVWWMCGIKG